MTRISNTKLAKVAAKKLLPFDMRLLRAISVGKGEWTDYKGDLRYDDAFDRLIDLELVISDGTKWIIAATGKIVLEATTAPTLATFTVSATGVNYNLLSEEDFEEP